MTNTSVTQLMSVVWIAIAMLLPIFPMSTPIVILENGVNTTVMPIMSMEFGVQSMIHGKVTNTPWELHYIPVLGLEAMEIGITVMELVVEPMPSMQIAI